MKNDPCAHDNLLATRDFSQIADYAQLRASLDALSAQIAAADRKLTSWRSLLLPLLRRVRRRLERG